MTKSNRGPSSAAEWARAIFQHWKAQQPKGKSTSEEAFAEHAKLSRGGFRKLLDGDNRPRFDTMQKLRFVAPPHLKNLEPAQPAGSTQMSDPSARLASIRKRLGDALARRADKLTGPQVLALTREIDDLAARPGNTEVDEADIIVELLARIVGPGGRGDRG